MNKSPELLLSLMRKLAVEEHEDPANQIDISSVKSAEDMDCYFNNRNMLCLSSFYGDDFERALKIAAQAVEDYPKFKEKRVRANKIFLNELESCDAFFKLVVISMKFKTNKITIVDVDFPKLKNLIQKAYDNFRIFGPLGKIFEYFCEIFLEEKHLMIARVFLMLEKSCIKRSAVFLDQVELGFKSADLQFELLRAELSFMEELMSTSLEMMKHDNMMTEQQEAREEIFKDLLKLMGVEDNYAGVPNVIQHFKHAEKASHIMIPRLDFCQKLCGEGVALKLKSNTLILIDFLRGQMYFLMSEYQKESNLKLDLAEKSIKHWNLMRKRLTKKNLKDYLEQTSIHHYQKMLMNSIFNYSRIIKSKCEAIMELDFTEVQFQLKDINILRSDYIGCFQAFLFFYTVCPGLSNDYLVGELYNGIAEQFRSIILNNKESQDQNLEMSLKYCKKYFQCKLKCRNVPPSQINEVMERIFVHKMITTIDNYKFVKKFRLF